MDDYDPFGFKKNNEEALKSIKVGYSNKLHEKFTIDDIEDFEEAFWEWT